MFKTITCALALLAPCPAFADAAPPPAKEAAPAQPAPVYATADTILQTLQKVEAQVQAEDKAAKRKPAGPADQTGPLAITPAGCKAACKNFETATGRKAVRAVGTKTTETLKVGRGGGVSSKTQVVYGPKWSVQRVGNLADARELFGDYMRAVPPTKKGYDVAEVVQAWKVANGFTPKQAEEFAAKVAAAAKKD